MSKATGSVAFMCEPHGVDLITEAILLCVGSNRRETLHKLALTGRYPT